MKKSDISEQEDWVTDIVSLMASFSGKLYGRRSTERRRNKKEVKYSENNDTDVVL